MPNVPARALDPLPAPCAALMTLHTHVAWRARATATSAPLAAGAGDLSPCTTLSAAGKKRPRWTVGGALEPREHDDTATQLGKAPKLARLDLSSCVLNLKKKRPLPEDVEVVGSKVCFASGQDLCLRYGDAHVLARGGYDLSMYASWDNPFQYKGRNFASVAHALSWERVGEECRWLFEAEGLLSDAEAAAEALIPEVGCDVATIDQLREARKALVATEPKALKTSNAHSMRKQREWQRRHGGELAELDERLAEAVAVENCTPMRQCRPLARPDKFRQVRERLKDNIASTALRLPRTGVLAALAMRPEVSGRLGIRQRTRDERGEHGTKLGEAQLLADILLAKCDSLPRFAECLRLSEGHLVENPHEEILSPEEPDEDLTRASQWTAFATHDGRLVGCNMTGEVLMHVRDVLRARA